MPKIELTVGLLCNEARVFSVAESGHAEPLLYGVTDGKAVGTYLEHKFRLHLRERYSFTEGNSAEGTDFPGCGRPDWMEVKGWEGWRSWV